MKSLLREPLLHFLAIDAGGALLALSPLNV